jgi:hypothetical protein
MAQQSEVKIVKDAHKEVILSKPNVVGIGVGYKIKGQQKTSDLSVVVLVRQKIPQAGLTAEMMVPQRVDTIPTDVIEVGEIKALQARTDRWRPAPGGVSIGHYQITAGTFGAVVRDRTTNERLILSNNHVLANSNNANPGDAILQPGAADGGQAAQDTIAHLVRFCPIQFSIDEGNCDIANTFANLGNALAQLLGSKHRLKAFQADPAATNLVDAAVARPINDADILNNILEIGEVSGKMEAVLGMPVRKSGRTTELTTGEITLLDATVNVSYGIGRIAQFDGQIVSGPMSQGGDSGSLLVAGDSLQAVGLLFAGSEQTTIYNPIQAVLDCLEVDL